MKRTACAVALGTLFLAGCHRSPRSCRPSRKIDARRGRGSHVADPVDPGGEVARPGRPRRLRWLRPPPPPTPEPDTAATPPPSAGGCGNPVPRTWRASTRRSTSGAQSRWTLDSTPTSAPIATSAARSGTPMAGSFCPVRTEGAPNRVAWETYVVGRAKDTGRPGPTWYRDGRALHRGGQRLREPRRQSVRAVCLRGRALPALRQQRDLRPGHGRPVMQRTPALTAGAAPCERVRVTRDGRTRALGAVLAATCLLAWGCSSLPDKTPTQPDPPTQPVAAAPTAEPNPNPTAPRRSWGGPGPSPPRPRRRTPPRIRARLQDSAAGLPAPAAAPLPPALGDINVKIHQTGRRCMAPRFDAPRRA